MCMCFVIVHVFEIVQVYVFVIMYVYVYLLVYLRVCVWKTNDGRQKSIEIVSVCMCACVSLVCVRV